MNGAKEEQPKQRRVTVKLMLGNLIVAKENLRRAISRRAAAAGARIAEGNAGKLAEKAHV